MIDLRLTPSYFRGFRKKRNIFLNIHIEFLLSDYFVKSFKSILRLQIIDKIMYLSVYHITKDSRMHLATNEREEGPPTGILRTCGHIFSLKHNFVELLVSVES